MEIGKVGTGIKEKNSLNAENGISFDDLTKKLKSLIIKEDGKNVSIKPKIVVAVTYQEIQKSPTYASGYALRFPRVIGLRTMDKGPEEASTIDYVKKLFEGQKKR